MQNSKQKFSSSTGNDRQASSLIFHLSSKNGDDFSPEELAEIWARRAHALAEEPPAESTGETADLLIFRLGDERYGIPVHNVREIYPLTKLTTVPRAPGFVAGVFSARGRILSVIDLGAFLDLPALELSEQTKIIVVANTEHESETAQMEVGILADEVADVTTIFEADIEPPLTTQAGSRTEYIQGVTANMLIVLSLNALLNDQRLIVCEEVK